MIRVENDLFILDTGASTYCFEKMPSGHLEHLYYGKSIKVNSKAYLSLREKNAAGPGNSIAYTQDLTALCLEDVRLEMSSLGKGDIRPPFISVVHADGSTTSDFLFDSYIIDNKKVDMGLLPGSYNESGEYDHLQVNLLDSSYNLTLELHYYVYEDCDCITRFAKLINTSNDEVCIDRLMSLQLDLDDSDYIVNSFHGAWTREMHIKKNKLSGGCLLNSSLTGTSSNRTNPFFMLTRPTTDENHGECIGFNLMYSGNHAEYVDVNAYDKTRVLAGINPEGFMWSLNPGEEFVTPEAVFTYSSKGLNAMSLNMHGFVREHVVRGEWKKKNRPVLLNSWEAAYFKINEKKLVDLAREAKNVGIELFVMDDGWFGKRDDDTSSLGDWEVNLKKLPNGLKGLCDKITEQGLMFGIWVEPEMINVKSNLYANHPEWVLQIPGKPHSEGRNQRILDYTRDDVCEYIIGEMTKVFSMADISYVKWDMNRIFSDVFSSSLPANRQGEVTHRYVLGLYKVMDALTRKFPHILFEGCASGGNRFDLGILSYFPQIWASDDTDAYERCFIQNGYSYGYPQSVVTAHVSGCPNHQTLRNSPMETRFNVAFFGTLGYEFNLCDLSQDEKEEIKTQVALYKAWREVIQWGDFYRGRNFDESRFTEWTCVSKDKARAVGMLMQDRVIPNYSHKKYYAKGLDEDTLYRFNNIDRKVDIRLFGDLINMFSPIPMKKDSLAVDIAAKFVKLDGEKEDYLAYGDSLVNAGVNLKQSFAGTGFSDQIAYYQDLGSRLYFMEAVKED